MIDLVCGSWWVRKKTYSPREKHTHANSDHLKRLLRNRSVCVRKKIPILWHIRWFMWQCRRRCKLFVENEWKACELKMCRHFSSGTLQTLPFLDSFYTRIQWRGMMNYAIRLFKFIKAKMKFLIRCYAISNNHLHVTAATATQYAYKLSNWDLWYELVCALARRSAATCSSKYGHQLRRRLDFKMPSRVLIHI